VATSLLRLGTRGSQLALFQAHAVADLLHHHAAITCEIVIIKTSGDRLADATLAEIGGKRLFVKEIEDALLAGDIDLAVHSSKDMPAMLPPGLAIGAVLPREEPRDALVFPGEIAPLLSLEAMVARLGRAPRIGTSSVRRTAQLTAIFPGATFLPIRGNLDTRLRKLDEGHYDALVLAAAGLKRLQQAARIGGLLPLDACVPAPGQGIIAVEARSDNVETLKRIGEINDGPAYAAFQAERAVVTRLGGGCQMPIGAYASISEGLLRLTAVVLSLDGTRAVRATADGRADTAHDIGVKAADDLLSQGAAEILDAVQRADAAVEGLQP